jgi:uncharacterized repeat protein (TIGR01451 family)
VISAKRALALALILLPATALPAPATAATPGPAWAISAIAASPTDFVPGDSSGDDVYAIQATNVGSVPTNGSEITITDVLPPGLSLDPHPTGLLFSSGLILPLFGQTETPLNFTSCSPGPPVSCNTAAIVPPGKRVMMIVPVDVAPGAPPSVTNQVSVSGGGAAGVSSSVQTTVSSQPAPFGIQGFESSLLGSDGAPEARAGSHPYQLRAAAEFNSVIRSRTAVPAENPRDITADLPAGLVLNPHATPTRCTESQLETRIDSQGDTECPNAATVGLAHTIVGLPGYATPEFTNPIYNMVPPPGAAAELAFNAGGTGIYVHLIGRLRSDGDYGLSSDTLDVPQFGNIIGTSVELWGDPSDPSHDARRGRCGTIVAPEACPVPATTTPLITMPSACSGPLGFSIHADSWQHHGTFVSRSAQTEDAAGNPVGVTGCDKLSYAPAIESTPSTDKAETGSGLDFNVDFPDNGLLKKEALAESTTTKAVVTLPEGVTINPSVGEGLGFCTPAQYKKESATSLEGEGCPDDSKVGTLHLSTPLLDESLDGAVYLAQQDNPETTEHGAENPFDTDIALYLVLRNSERGILVKKPLKVEPDPKTGQLVATLEEIPPLPFSHFNFHFKEGARAALVTPAACGKYTTVARFYPSSDPANPKTVTSDFEISKGVGGGPCPSGGVPPFHPEFAAGSVNNGAGSFSPFGMRLIRHDGEQDMTKFSAVLPPGVLGKLAGVSKCPDAAITAAKSKTGRQEKAAPSCPASSEIGHTLAGAGVGDSLTYVPGQLYLGGPYHGDPLSVVSITPALAGPFDAGTVVVRVALTLNPETAEVEVDGAASDPIPHILKGIVLKVRDLRVYVDRERFILNPTSCDPSSVKATLFGAYLNVFDPSDDVPVGLQTRFQAVDCARLGFKPKLALKLKGGTKRGAHPALRAEVTPRAGDANFAGAVVTLPHSAFLDQAHIRTICTRVQFAEFPGNGAKCPPGSVYGHVRATTPLLEEALEGPVYLRSSSHNLPDLVVALHGLVDVTLDSRIDSFKGGIRSSFAAIPDAPVSKFVLEMQGGKKGLIVNSTNLCASVNRAGAKLTGQNGRLDQIHPLVQNDCGKGGRKGKHKRH